MLCHPGSSSTPPERQLRTLNREEPLKHDFSVEGSERFSGEFGVYIFRNY